MFIFSVDKRTSRWWYTYICSYWTGTSRRFHIN